MTPKLSLYQIVTQQFIHAADLTRMCARSWPSR